MTRHVLEIPWIDPCEAFAAFAEQPYSLFLDSADQNHPDARYSFIAAYPTEMIEAKDGLITITNAQKQTRFKACPFETVKKRLAFWGMDSPPEAGLPPFQGGAAGIFSYDLARGIERLPATAAQNNDIPDMAIGIYDQVLAFDHQTHKAWIIGREAKMEFIRSVLMGGTSHATNAIQTPLWKSNFYESAYKKNVERVIDYIRAGDIFQANLSQRFEAALPKNFDSFAHYKTLRAVNPAPFAGYMNLGSIKISSASPERFLSVRDDRIETKPIKGTRPRLSDPAADQSQIEDLKNSDKDRTENIMIVDLLRNDLSKVCEPRSVAVEKLCEVESFASVHHLVSTITGTLSPNQTSLDALRACFPGGSITGAPKIRAMEIIEELEPQRRGAYCGAMGYIGFDGEMDMNIMIRTLTFEPGRVSFQAGGGITADSDPAQEYQETLDKAAAIFKSFEGEAQEQKSG